MTLIRRPSPFGELLSLRQAMDRLFEDSFVRPRGGSSGGSEEHQLALDIYATSDSLVVEAALPGVKPEDVDISVLGDTLTISATTHDEQSRSDEGYSYREIRRGAFSRQVTLPGGLKPDAAIASFENGLLRLSFPKADEARPRQIQIKPSIGARAESNGDWQSTQPMQSAQQFGQPEQHYGQSDEQYGQADGQPQSDQYGQPQSDQTTDQWRSSNEWQSNGQSQTNEQPRVEQGS